MASEKKAAESQRSAQLRDGIALYHMARQSQKRATPKKSKQK